MVDVLPLVCREGAGRNRLATIQTTDQIDCMDAFTFQHPNRFLQFNRNDNVGFDVSDETQNERGGSCYFLGLVRLVT